MKQKEETEEIKSEFRKSKKNFALSLGVLQFETSSVCNSIKILST